MQTAFKHHQNISSFRLCTYFIACNISKIQVYPISAENLTKLLFDTTMKPYKFIQDMQNNEQAKPQFLNDYNNHAFWQMG